MVCYYRNWSLTNCHNNKNNKIIWLKVFFGSNDLANMDFLFFFWFFPKRIHRDTHKYEVKTLVVRIVYALSLVPLRVTNCDSRPYTGKHVYTVCYSRLSYSLSHRSLKTTIDIQIYVSACHYLINLIWIGGGSTF